MEKPAPDHRPSSDDVPDNGHELAKRIGLQRPMKKDPEDTVSGGFNQKSKPDQRS